MAHQGKFIYYQHIKRLSFIALVKELFSFLDPFAEIEAHKIQPSDKNNDSTAKIQDAIIRAESETEEPEPVNEDR